MINTELSPWPCYTNEEADAVSQVLLSNRVNYWTGNEGREFEREFSSWCNCNYGVALSNGTLALEAAFYALGLGKGDEVIVTSRTFIASVSSIVISGATPVFADVDTDSQNITAETIFAVLTPRTRAIVCVHLAGWPCDMDEIMVLANEHNLYVIEDCAQAHGAIYKGRPVGSIGHVAAWSFCQDKIISTGGEGGMVTTNDRELWSIIWSYKDHGKSYDTVYRREHDSGFRWLHESFGTNWRMTEMQAVIGRLQLKKLPIWREMRTRNAKLLQDVCMQFPQSLRVPSVPDDIEHAWYKFYVFVRHEGLSDGWCRDRIMHEINALGVPCYSGSCSEVYLESAFDETSFRPQKRLPVARDLGETSLMFLVHPTLTIDEIARTRDAIRQVMSQTSKQNS
jgi:dTDP-4-amino-4,6-dideoxygalactose transaminase